MARRKRWPWFVLLIVVLAAAGGGGYYYSQVYVSAQAPAEPDLRTTRARVGELVMSATGAGTVIPASEIELGFQTTGTLTEVNVSIGDKASAGDVLARIDDLNARKSLTAGVLL